MPQESLSFQWPTFSRERRKEKKNELNNMYIALLFWFLLITSQHSGFIFSELEFLKQPDNRSLKTPGKLPQFGSARRERRAVGGRLAYANKVRSL